MIVANELTYSIRVNQKLAFARVLLQAAKEQKADTSIPAQQKVHAFLDSATSQLHDALCNFLIEISVKDNPAIKIDTYSIPIILQQLQDQEIDNPLNREVKNLLGKDNWLSSLVRAKSDQDWLRNEFNAHLQKDNEKNSNTKPLTMGIPLVDLDQFPGLSPLNLIIKWQTDLQAFIELHRNLIVED